MEVATLSTPRRYASTVALDEGRTWISGGYDGSARVDSSDIFEEDGVVVSNGPTLPLPLWQHCSARYVRVEKTKHFNKGTTAYQLENTRSAFFIHPGHELSTNL